MADKKISALDPSTIPLAGTEVLAIVQSGATVKVSVSDLTTGRSISALGMTISGLTASTALALDAGKVAVSVTNTGTGNNVLSTSPTLVSPIISTTITGSGAVISTLNGTGTNSTVDSTTYTVTFGTSAKVFWVSLGSGDACLVVANYKSATITLVGTPGIIVASSTPGAGEFGIYKSADNHAISFKTGSAANAAYGSWQVMCLSSTAT